MLAFIKTHSMTDAENLGRVRQMMDVGNYIDYKAAEIFNYRWDIGNHRLWRPRTASGRWRWLQFDNDVSWGGFWAQPSPWAFDMFAADTTPSGSLYGHNQERETFLLRRLLESRVFREEFVVRFADLLNAVYVTERTRARVDRFAAILEPEMKEHIARWRSPGSMDEWSNNVRQLREFAMKRPDHVRRQIMARFGFKGLAQLTVAVQGPDQCEIRINTLRLAVNSNTNWSGTYFRDMNIEATTIPPQGWRFVRWRGAMTNASNRLTFPLSGDARLTAIFER